MKKRRSLGAAAAVAVILATSAVAQAAGQTGGVPGLDARVTGLETEVATQGAAGATLQGQVTTLQNQVTTDQSAIDSLQTQIDTLQGHLPKFAVVERDGSLIASRGVISARHFTDQSGNPLTGAYLVYFDHDLSLCAITVTPEPEYGAGLKGIVNGTFRGFPNPLIPRNAANIGMFDEDGNFIDVRFNIMVTC